MPDRSPATNVTELIDARPLSGLQIRVFVLCALVMLLDGANTIGMGVTAPSIAASLGIKMSAFGPVFSAGQAGLLLGALAFGPLADRWGRKRLVIAATVIFGIFTLITVWAGSFNEFLLCRLAAGVGLGGASPNVVALTSEYAPKRMRSALVTAMWAAFPFGGVLIGFAGAVFITRFGWQSMFYLGGVLPMLLSVLLAAALPESPGFLVTHGSDAPRVAWIVSRIAPELEAAALRRFVVNDEKLPGVPVKHLFAEGRAVDTLLIWVPFFSVFLVLVSVTSWTPALLRSDGLSVSTASIAIALNSIGSVIGSGIVGRVMDRFGAYSVLTLAFLGTAASVGALGLVRAGFDLVAVATTLSGFFAGGGQAGMVALAAVTYPIAVRSTGVGWAIAVGRFGAVVGPLLGGTLLAWNWRVDHVFLTFAVPGLCGAGAVLLIKQRAAGKSLNAVRTAALRGV